MKRRLTTEPHYSPTAGQRMMSELAGITMARMGEQREDVRDRKFAAKFWLQAAKWEQRIFGTPIFQPRSSRLVWTGITWRTPSLP